MWQQIWLSAAKLYNYLWIISSIIVLVQHVLHTWISISTPSSANSEHKQIVYQPAQKRFSMLDCITVNLSFSTAGLRLWSSVHYSYLRLLEKAYNHLLQLLLISISSIRYRTSLIFHLQSWWSKMMQINVKLAEPSFALRSRFIFSTQKKKTFVETHMWRAIEMASPQFCPRCSRMVLHCDDWQVMFAIYELGFCETSLKPWF